MITKRDQDALNFIEEFHFVTSSQIHKLFFSNTSYRYSRKRLQFLFEHGFIKRTRSTINNDFAYYLDKKSILQQIHHDLIRAELFTYMKQSYNVLEWNNEMTVEHIRPDALTYVNDHGIIFPVLVEIHLSNKFNFDKYKEFVRNDLKAMFGMIPRVIICTDRQVTVPSGMGIRFKVVGIDMKGLDSIFR